MKLDAVAEVFTGILIYREKVPHSDNEYRLFDIKNFQDGNYEYIKTNNKIFKQLTIEGDIVFRLVAPNKVVYIDSKNSGLLVSSQYCIIRCYKQIINPIFLKWYLESNLCKEQILLSVNGSVIPKITVTALKKLVIPEIDFDVQNKLGELIELWDRERNILTEIKNKKEILYNSLIEEVIEKSQNS